MKKESDLHRMLMMALTEDERVRVFRNNVGKAWIGEGRLMPDGSALINNARRFHAGLHVGSSDLIGWRSLVIAPHHVGRTLAVFTAVEVKQPGGMPTPEQRTFIDNVRRAGGVAGVAHSVAEARALLASID